MSKGPADTDERPKASAADAPFLSAGASKLPRRPRRYIKPEKSVDWRAKAAGQISIAAASAPAQDED